MPYKVNEPVEPQQRAVIDDDQLKRMMADSQPSFFERNRYRLVTLALIAINVAVSVSYTHMTLPTILRV